MTTATTIKNTIRKNYVDFLMKVLSDAGEEVLQVKTNELSIPVVGADGNEYYVNFTIKVPNGSRDGDEYDGYAEAEDFALKMRLKAEKAADKAKAKAAKIEKDKVRRAAKKEAQS